jgi:hypothetical protein
MKIEKFEHTLELDERVDLHKKGWVIQRVLWIVYGLFIIVAALGLFGNGPLSKVKKNAGKSFIEFERFARYSNITELKIFAQPVNGSNKVVFPIKYLQDFQVEKIIPQPESQNIKADQLIYVFPNSPVNIAFEFKPEKVGMIESEIQINQTNIKLSQIIYP